MAKKSKYRVLKVGGKSYKLRLTVNAICDFENEINHRRRDGERYIGFFEVAREMKNQNFTMEQVRALLWAALLEEHGDQGIEPDEAGEILHECGIPRAMTVLGDAIADQFGTEGAPVQPMPVEAGASGGA